MRLPAKHLPRHAHAAGERQRNVQQQHVGLRLIHERVGILRLARLSDELEVGLGREQSPESLAEQAVIIDQTELQRHTGMTYVVSAGCGTG